MLSLTKQHITTIKDAAKKLTGAKRREFQAQVSIDYLNSKPHWAEKIFGWDSKTVALGLNELRSGVVCIDDFNPYLTHIIIIFLKTICCALKNLRVALHLKN